MAAQETGAELLVIGREQEEEGISPEALLALLEKTYGIALQPKAEEDLGQWFPLFTNIAGKAVVVVGAGRIAKRRIETLLKFDCRIRVVAAGAVPEVEAYAGQGKLELHIKPYEASDLEGADYVLASTNDPTINHQIYERCREGNIPVNVADDKEKSDFYFPGVIRKNGLTVGITAEGKDHELAKKATRAIAGCLDRCLQEDEKIETEKN
jgi:siroheme synthase-like protein